MTDHEHDEHDEHDPTPEEVDAMRESYRKAFGGETMERVDAYGRDEPWTIHPADVELEHIVQLHPLDQTQIGLLVSRSTSTWILSTGIAGIRDYAGQDVHSFGWGIGAGAKGDVLVVTSAADAGAADAEDGEEVECENVGYDTTITSGAAREWAAALLRMADEADANAEGYGRTIQANLALALAEQLRNSGVKFNPEDIADVGGAVAQAVAENGSVFALTSTGKPIVIQKMTDEQEARIDAGEDPRDVIGDIGEEL